MTCWARAAQASWSSNCGFSNFAFWFALVVGVSNSWSAFLCFSNFAVFCVSIGNWGAGQLFSNLLIFQFDCSACASVGGGGAE